MNDREVQNIQYWNAFCDYLIQRGTEFRRPSLVAIERHFINLPMGIPNFALRASQRLKEGLGAALIIRGSNAGAYFRALEEEQAQIRVECGEYLSWYSGASTEKRIAFIKADADPTDEQDWSNQHEWIASKLGSVYI